MAGLFADQDQYFGGIIVMDADATATPGFGYRYAHGSVLLHELGPHHGSGPREGPRPAHVLGTSPEFQRAATSVPGDLEGLRRLGEDAGCLD